MRLAKLNKKTLLMLGSGATAGSGYSFKSAGNSCEVSLPIDAKFFDQKSPTAQLLEHYPALQCLKQRVAKNVNSLCHTWTALYNYRGLANAGIVHEGTEVLETFAKLPDDKRLKDWQKRHYKIQFEIRDFRPAEYFLSELAIWDLRCLVQEVYWEPHGEEACYKEFWKELPKKFSVEEPFAVINLNYDTTFINVCLLNSERGSFALMGPWTGHRPPSGPGPLEGL
ncbi:MAG: hypothetical protein HYZ73_03600 [Elusimicrobia bacterium]|nr:hypothetical protein [Elusimicrobiota bacterium]